MTKFKLVPFETEISYFDDDGTVVNKKVKGKFMIGLSEIKVFELEMVDYV